MRAIVCMVVLGGCGRLGFGSVDVDASAGDAPVQDAPPDPDAPAGATVLRFGETPTATNTGVTFDTFLVSEVPQDGNNFGASGTIGCEGIEKRGLLRFDLTAIPPGATIVSARLHLAMTAESAGGTVTLATLGEAWTEGDLVGASGVANWNQRTAGQAWTTAGAGSPGSAGVQIASFAAPQSGAVSADVAATAIQSWVDTPSGNFGAVLSSSGGGDVRIDASESATAGNRPELVVTFFP